MTKVYFVRHAKPDLNIHDDLIRPLTEEGTEDSKKVTEFLLNKKITKAFSSPYKRAVDTIKDFTDRTSLKISIVEDFRERKIDSEWIENFDEFSEKQWRDFEYKLSDGENLKEVHKRNIAALQQILKENMDDNIVIGTHGTALSTIINYYDKNFDYKEFKRIRYYMPLIICITFEGQDAVKIEQVLLIL